MKVAEKNEKKMTKVKKMKKNDSGQPEKCNLNLRLLHPNILSCMTLQMTNKHETFIMNILAK